MIIDIARNIAILFALCMGYTMIFRNWDRRSLSGRLLAGVVFGFSAVIGMYTPVEFAPGIIFDGRSILLSMAGLFGGGLSAVIAVVITAATRVAIGGEGVYMGCGVIASSAALGVGYRYLCRMKTTHIKNSSLLLFGLVVHIVMLLWTLVLPADVRWQVLRTITVPVLLVHSIGTILVGRLLSDQDAWYDTNRLLHESEEQYRILFESCPDGVLVADADSRKFMFANPAICDFLGYTEEELTGMRVLDIHPDDALDYVLSKFEMQSKKGKVLAEDIPCLRKDGTVAWVDVNAVPISFGGKSALLGFFRDVTERKQYENDLLKNQSFLQRSQEIGSVGSWMRDVAKNGLFWSDENYRIFGLPVGTPLTYDNFLNCIHPEDREYVENEAKAALHGKPYDIEHRVLADGKVKWVREKGEFEFDEKGQCVRGFGVTQDITLLKRNEEERVKLEAQVQHAQKLESLGVLAGGIAHDFNNILAAILGFSEFAREDAEEGSEMQQNLDEVIKASNRAGALVKQILTFSRKTGSAKEITRLQPIIQEALKLLRGTLPTTIEIREDLDEKCDAAEVDPTQIHQIIMNLCTNAYHAMQERGGVLTVSLKEEALDSESVKRYANLEEGRYAHLIVTDTGHGMDEETKGRIFEPYFTTKDKSKGSGLGLATVYGIIRSYDGNIFVSSKVGSGTVFDVFLPLCEEEMLSTREKPVDLGVIRGNERVLFVDDEESLTHAGKILLEKLGYKVEPYTSSPEALSAFRANPSFFDVVITDFTMPKMTGIDLADHLLEIRPDIPIILCTGYSDAIDEKIVLASGIKVFINKPVPIQDLAKCIRQVLDKEV